MMLVIVEDDVSKLSCHLVQLTRAYFAFLEVLFNSHNVFVLNLEANTFIHVVGSLESGLKALDTGISSQVYYDESIPDGSFSTIAAYILLSATAHPLL